MKYIKTKPNFTTQIKFCQVCGREYREAWGFVILPAALSTHVAELCGECCRGLKYAGNREAVANKMVGRLLSTRRVA